MGLRRFSAHQCIVSSRSEVLATIIQDQKLKCNDEVVEVTLTDVPAEVFKQILKYIYTNTCEFLVPGQCDVKYGDTKLLEAWNFIFDFSGLISTRRADRLKRKNPRHRIPTTI